VKYTPACCIIMFKKGNVGDKPGEKSGMEGNR